jgi:hypothetical protein
MVYLGTELCIMIAYIATAAMYAPPATEARRGHLPSSYPEEEPQRRANRPHLCATRCGLRQPAISMAQGVAA